MNVAGYILAFCLSIVQNSVSQKLNVAEPVNIEDTKIRKKLSGMKTVASDPKDGEIIFSEIFQSDGIWYGFRSEIALVKFTGYWSVSNGNICIKGNNNSNKCRKIIFLDEKNITISDFDTEGDKQFRFTLKSITRE